MWCNLSTNCVGNFQLRSSWSYHTQFESDVPRSTEHHINVLSLWWPKNWNYGWTLLLIHLHQWNLLGRWLNLYFDLDRVGVVVDTSVCLQSTSEQVLAPLRQASLPTPHIITSIFSFPSEICRKWKIKQCCRQGGFMSNMGLLLTLNEKHLLLATNEIFVLAQIHKYF